MAPGERSSISIRSISLGLLGVLLISLLTPFNNYVLNNTDLIGNHLSIGVLIFLLGANVVLNGALNRWAPALAMSRGELSVALAMVLVGCAVPNVGLMRYLPGYLVGPWYHSASNPEFANLMRQLDLPEWMFPTMQSIDPVSRGNEKVVRDFYLSVPLQDRTFLTGLQAVPFAAWLMPAITWSVFFGCLFVAVMCIGLIFRRQWAENERLPFPLASIYLSVLEPPEKGRFFNTLFRSRAFWITAGLVFATHTLGALHEYNPKHFPQIPLTFDLRDIFSERPWIFFDEFFKKQTLFFTIIGLVWFVRSSLAFSIWFFYLVVQVFRLMTGSMERDFTTALQHDQVLGGLVPFTLAMLYVARHHLAAVIRQMLRGHRAGEPRATYVPYSILGWIFLGCALTMIVWLTLAGMTVIGAVFLVTMLMLGMLVVMRIVAETGMIYVLLPVPFQRPWLYLAHDLPTGLTVKTTSQNFFLSAAMFGMQTHDTRESLAGFFPNALRLGDEGAGLTASTSYRPTTRFVLCLLAALLVAYIAGGASALWTHYNFASTLDTKQEMVGMWGSFTSVRTLAMSSTVQFQSPVSSIDAHDRLAHVGVGAAITAFLSIMRLRIAGWPFEPIGYLLVYTWGIQQVWFSVLLGWIAKVLLLRLGGSKLLQSSRTVFLGLILGECTAAGVWLVISFVLAVSGEEYRAIRLMPY